MQHSILNLDTASADELNAELDRRDVDRRERERRAGERAREENGSKTLRMKVGDFFKLEFDLRRIAALGGILGTLGLGGVVYKTSAAEQAPALAAHAAMSSDGRLAVVETEVATLKGAVNRLIQITDQQRQEQLEQWKWQAEQAQDPVRARAIQRQLSEMGSRP